MLDGRQWPLLQIYACRNSVWSMLTSLLLLSGAPSDVALRQGRGCARSSTACRPLARRAYSGSGNNTMIGPCSLAGINRSSSSSCMKTKKKATRIRTCRHQPGFPADKDLRTQYEWSKTWMKKRARQLAPRMDEFRASQANGPALRIRG